MSDTVLALAAEVIATDTRVSMSVSIVSARKLAHAVIDQQAELADRRAADLTREELEALRGCTVHCQNEKQRKLATAAIDKIAALADLTLRWAGRAR